MSTFSVSTLIVGFLVVVSVWFVFSGEEVSVLSVVVWSSVTVASLVVAFSTVDSSLAVFSALLISVAVSTWVFSEIVSVFWVISEFTGVDWSSFEVETSVVDSGVISSTEDSVVSVVPPLWFR